MRPTMPRPCQIWGTWYSIIQLTTYGDSRSRKSHRIIRYKFERANKFGLCLSAAQYLNRRLDKLNNETGTAAAADNDDYASRRRIGLRMYEQRIIQLPISSMSIANAISAGHMMDWRISGARRTLEEGKVRIRPIVTKACWSFEDLRRELLADR